ncbi:hypothetical protein F442_22875, partial [Phytophthora nicotianae P10297]
MLYLMQEVPTQTFGALWMVLSEVCVDLYRDVYITRKESFS